MELMRSVLEPMMIKFILQIGTLQNQTEPKILFIVEKVMMRYGSIPAWIRTKSVKIAKYFTRVNRPLLTRPDTYQYLHNSLRIYRVFQNGLKSNVPRMSKMSVCCAISNAFSFSVSS